MRLVEAVVPKDSNALLRVFGTLQLLPNLHELQVDTAAWSSIGSGVGVSDGDLATNVLRDLAPRISSVFVNDVYPASASRILSDFSTRNLKTVRVGIFSESWIPVKDATVLRDALAQMPRLARLILESARPGQQLVLGPEWAQGTWDTSLRSLEITGAPIDANLLAFVDRFSATLEHLTIRASADQPPFTSPTPILPSTFPVLASLTLANVAAVTVELFLRSVALPPRPAGSKSTPIGSPLQSIDISFKNTTGVEASLYYLCAKKIATLRSLRCVQRDGSPVTQVARLLADVCEKRDITFSADSKEDPSLAVRRSR